MNLNSFLYVAEIERCGSINRAAQNLYTSQSNLSTALKSLDIQYLNVLVTAAFLPRKAIFLSSLQRLSWRKWRK